MLYPGLKERAERELGIRVFGYVPELKNLTLESRHLGLVMPEEILGIRERLDLIKEKVRAGINLDGIIEESGRAAEIEVKLPEAVRQFCNVDCGKVLNNSAAQHIENIADAKKIYDSGNTHEVKSTLSDRSVKKTVVAVAKDEAFCFYYEDNLDLLKKLGAEIQYFPRSTTETFRWEPAQSILAAVIRSFMRKHFQKISVCGMRSVRR